MTDDMEHEENKTNQVDQKNITEGKVSSPPKVSGEPRIDKGKVEKAPTQKSSPTDKKSVDKNNVSQSKSGDSKPLGTEFFKAFEDRTEKFSWELRDMSPESAKDKVALIIVALVIGIPLFLGLSFVIDQFTSIAKFIGYILAFAIAAPFSYVCYVAYRENFKEIIGALKRPSPTSFVVLSLVVLSFYTTSEGLLSIIIEEGTVENGMQIFFTRYFVFVMTIALAMSVANLFTPQKATAKILTFVGWLALALFSISFSFAFFWERLESRNVARTTAKNEITLASDELSLLSGLVSDTQSLSQRLALESLKKSWMEQGVETDGKGAPLQINAAGEPVKTPGFGANTCGVFTSQSDGPRSRMRRSLSDQFNSDLLLIEDVSGAIKNDITALSKQLEAIESFESTPENEPARVALFAQANVTLTGARRNYNRLKSDAGPFQSMKLSYSRWAEMFESNQPVFKNWGGVGFSCPDMNMSNNLNSVVNRFNSLPDLQSTQLKSYSGAEATREALNRFINSVTSIATTPFKFASSILFRGTEVDQNDINQGRNAAKNGNISSSPDKSHQSNKIGTTDSQALWIALLVDGLLFIFSYLDPASRQFASMFQARRRFAEQAAMDPMADIEAMAAIQTDPNYMLMSNHLVKHVNWDYMVVPQANRTIDENTLLSWLELLKQYQIVKPTFVGPWSRVFFKQYRKQREDIFKRAGNDIFVYRISSNALAEIYMRYIARNKS